MPRRPTAAVIAALALGTAACAEPAPSSGSGRRTPAPVAVGDAAARCSALSGPFQQDGDASAVDFDPARHRDRLARLSALFDATDPDIDDFVDHGGKLILVHGTLDWLVPRSATGAYYERLADRYGDAVRDSLRYYVQPGYGHARGPFDLGWDSLTALEDWVERGVAPDNPVARDGNPATSGRAMPLCEYPAWPRYEGAGDPIAASGFRCVAGS